MRHPETCKPNVGFLIWRFEEGYTKDDDEVKERFEWVLPVLEECIHHRQAVYYDYDDPTTIVMVGGWRSCEEHYEVLHKSEEFMSILMEFGGVLDVRSSFHANIPYARLEEMIDDEVLLMTRTWVADANEPEFDTRYGSEWATRASKAVGRPVSFGWRITDAGWSEKDALEYVKNETGISVEEEELQQLNEGDTIAGFESIEQAATAQSNTLFASDQDRASLVKREFSRRLVKLDLNFEDAESPEGLD